MTKRVCVGLCVCRHNSSPFIPTHDELSPLIARGLWTCIGAYLDLATVDFLEEFADGMVALDINRHCNTDPNPSSQLQQPPNSNSVSRRSRNTHPTA
eukprot:336650-Rhodomonas_salina.4